MKRRKFISICVIGTGTSSLSGCISTDECEIPSASFQPSFTDTGELTLTYTAEQEINGENIRISYTDVDEESRQEQFSDRIINQGDSFTTSYQVLEEQEVTILWSEGDCQGILRELDISVL